MGDVRTAVAERDQRREEQATRRAAYIEKLGPEIARVLPRHIPEQRIVRITITAIRQNPDLAACSALSLAGAVMVASTLGLELNTPTAEAYLVPYKGEATLILGYQGLAKLAYQSGLVTLLDAQAVYPEDEFDWAKGTQPYIHHKPRPLDRAKDSEPVYYYAVAQLKTGAPAFEVLTADQVKTLRAGKVGPKGDIPDPQHWMERKTPVRQLVKLLPKSPLLALAVDVDEHSGTELYAQHVRSTRVDQDPGWPEGMPEVGPAQGAGESRAQRSRPTTDGPTVVEDPPPGGEDL